MKSIYFIHGDKGGCGKSFFATAIGSLFEQAQVPFLIVEADANDSGGQPDVAPRFENSSYSQVMKAPISGEGSTQDLIADLFEAIEQTDVEHVIVNTPAGASEHLEKVGELIGMAAQSLGYRLLIFYNLFKTDVALSRAVSVKNGSLAKFADEFYLVKSEFFGVPETPSELRKLHSIIVPVLHKNVMDKMASNQNLHDVLSSFFIMQRIQVEQFLNSLRGQGLLEILTIENQGERHGTE